MIILFKKNYDTFFDSEIIDIPPDFFTKNNYKRYVIFGAGANDFDFSKKNSLYGIESKGGFFHVAVLEENSVSNSVLNIEEASSQLNSLLFPIVASIGIIVALQVAILARRR